jgi:SNF2 family DNA or RNA helicase
MSPVYYHPKTKPYPYQAKAALRAVRQSNLAFLFDPGCGKTKAAIDAAAMQFMRGKVTRVVVVCPLMAIDVWKQQLREHMDPEVRRLMKWRVINYDKISRRQREHPTRKKSRWVYPHVARIAAFDPDLIIFDESHRCKRASANRSQAMWRLVRQLRQSRAGNDDRPYVYLLTGTPHPKGWIDVFSQFRIMDEGIFGTSLEDFKSLYCTYGMGPRRFTIVKYRNTHLIKQLIQENSYIISKDKALPWLPKQLWENVPVHLPLYVREMYAEMVEEMLVELEDGNELTAKNAGVLRTRLLQITGGRTTDGRVIHDTKFAALQSILEDLYDSHQQAVVYCRFLGEVSEAERMARSVGYRAGAITGSVGRETRTALVREFQGWGHDSSSPMCLVFQVDTGSLAITLTAGSEVIFYSLPDSWDSYWQATNRVHRPGQNHKVRYRHLIAPGTVDVSILRALRGKSDMHSELMGNPREFLFGG